MRIGAGVWAGLVAASLGLAACNPARMGEHRNERPLATLTRLDCPERQGDLQRIEVAPDGLSCRYTGDEREAVTLQLVALNGRMPQAVLGGIESELKRVVPIVAGPAAAPDKDASAEAPPVPIPPHPPVPPEPPGDGEHAHLDLPGLHIDADGDRAQVNLPGVHINADGDRADVRVDAPGGGRLASVHASDAGAEVRTGEITARNVNATYLLASDMPGPGGERAAGYVARGPVNGPLVVARMTDSEGRHDDHESLHDLKRLVDRNVRRSRTPG